ncbi:hypothetical protein FRB94_012525 [Tulasnella sp. JGI-2019a]|nr:hypothetical protein FRB94_012525 [Tulasnella sp. JGI-2019a]
MFHSIIDGSRWSTYHSTCKHPTKARTSSSRQVTQKHYRLPLIIIQHKTQFLVISARTILSRHTIMLNLITGGTSKCRPTPYHSTLRGSRQQHRAADAILSHITSFPIFVLCALSTSCHVAGLVLPPQNQLPYFVSACPSL